VLTPVCHHLAVVRNGGLIQIYLDGATTPLYTGALTGMLNTNLFRIGHWGGGTTAGQDWLGLVDEVRLWSVPRTIQQIQDFKDCILSGNSSGLVANWTFDQRPSVTPNGNNAGSVAIDMSGNGNNGIYSTVANGFALSGTTSNFVCNPCQPRYVLDISDQISLFPVLLTSICEGDYVHFCVSENFTLPVIVPSGTTVVWQSSDAGGPWVTDADMAGYALSTNATCFPVKKGVITNPDCGNIGPGFIDRKYRAKILKKMGAETCTYTTSEHNLRICCKPTGGTITIVPNIPAPWCEGDNISMTVFLNPSDPWLPFGPNVTVDWCLIEGSNVTVLPYQNLLSFGGLQIIVGTQDICLQAKIYNCGCPPITVELCIPVDPNPVCGLIDVVAVPPKPISPTPPAGFPYKYEICPGDYSELEMVSPFTNCDPVWQYHFGPPVPSPTSPGWVDLGGSNTIQNTNTLPQNDPTDPAYWPPTATCIYYRIECRPESYPNSGCDPCHSNMVEICLMPPPPSGTISGAQQFCQGGSTTLTITPFLPGNWTYCWYWNGVLEFTSTSPTFNATKPGNYWVEIKDGCQATKVGPYLVEECAIIPIIKCPTDNPCACDGLPITLDGCDSYDTCTGTTLTYTWSWNGGTLVSVNGCMLEHIPDPNGTTYTLTVSNSLNPACTDTSKPFFIKPCN